MPQPARRTTRPLSQTRQVNLLRQIRNLQRQAKDYAETGRDFPTFGAGKLTEQLDSLQATLIGPPPVDRQRCKPAR